jgi:transcriptional regulator with XRE-family HTH domain
MAKDPYKIACGARLRKTRIALGYTSVRKFARIMSEAEDNLGKWERGVAQVPPAFIGKMKELFGVTHDWIYDGDASGIRHELAIKLLRPEDEETGV